MCGICGVVEFQPGAAADGELLRRMCGVIVHRGPDDEGYDLAGRAGLGMRRLSIIDVDGGRQPMHSEDGSLRLVFNGEIYNYRELRAALEADGHQFATRSDTEVVVHAYEQEGEACLGRLRGMFALALWDARAEALLLAVDRFGIKPLYYAVDGRGLLFGSELSCLLASGRLAREIDPAALSQYFTLGYIPAPATVFRGARKLPPGHVLRWTAAAGVELRRYWDLPAGVEDCARPVDATRQALRAALRDSVRAHLVSDVPLGAFLSGGIDSSTVVALMSEVSAAPVKTFAIGFADRQHNELDAARLVAQRFGTDHHELIVEPDAVEVLPALVSHFGEPFADPSALPTYYVSKAARGHIKVALSGDGGDELFVGYTTFRGVELARYAQAIPAPVRGALARLPAGLPRTGSAAWNDRVARWRKWAADSVLPPDAAYRSKITRVPPAVQRALLSRDLLEQMDGASPYWAVDEALDAYPAGGRAHPLARLLYAGSKVALAGDMLVKVDRMSMAHSLEVRVPFVDHVLAELVATIPIAQRFPRWRLKGLLKDTMADVLPPAILNRPKRGFNVPLAAWLRGDLAGYAAGVLLGAEARRRGFFDTSAVGALLQRHRQGSGDLGAAIWSLLIFELWCRQALD